MKRKAAKVAATKIYEQLHICKEVSLKQEMKEWIQILDEKASEKKIKQKAKNSELNDQVIKKRRK